MKNKLSWFAVPYVVWMALMVVVPILIMVVYAFTTADFEGTTENFSEMGSYASVFLRSFRLAFVATLVCRSSATRCPTGWPTRAPASSGWPWP